MFMCHLLKEKIIDKYEVQIKGVGKKRILSKIARLTTAGCGSLTRLKNGVSKIIILK